YVLKSGGGDIRIKFFGARETSRGVTAAPWGVRRPYPGAFLSGGRKPNRVPLNMGGHAFRRVGKDRFPIKVVRSGLFIAEEMIKGNTEKVFFETANRE